MKNKQVNAARVWKQHEDSLAPRLNFSRTERAIYSHLFRHSRLEGKLKFRFSIAWLARGVQLSMKATRGSVRSLVARGVLDLIERNCRTEHAIRVRLPLEVKAVRTPKTAPLPSSKAAINIEEADFLEKQILRRSLHDLFNASPTQGLSFLARPVGRPNFSTTSAPLFITHFTLLMYRNLFHFAGGRAHGGGLLGLGVDGDQSYPAHSAVGCGNHVAASS